MTYHLTYSVTPRPEGIEKEAVPADHGACTALIVGSVAYHDDGSYSVFFASTDGRNARPLSDGEMWKAWLMWAKSLSESPDLPHFKREICEVVWGAVAESMRRQIAIASGKQHGDPEQST